MAKLPQVESGVTRFKPGGPPTSIRVSIPKDVRPEVEAANFFQIAHVGPEIQLLVGYIDPQELATKMGVEQKKGTANAVVSVEAELTHRFQLSLQGFATLKATVDQISKTLSMEE